MDKQTDNRFNPIVYINGDGGTARGADIVRAQIFRDFPTIDIPMSVEARIATNDGCIEEAVTALKEIGAGFKNSTASNDPKIRKLGWKSANIVMRPMAGAFALFRMLQGGGRYPKLCGTLRYSHGAFYDEQSCMEEIIDGKRTAVITQHLNLDDLQPFAKLAAEKAKEMDLHLILSSKSTIATSELLFRTEIENVWKEMGLTEGEGRDKDGNRWTGDFHHELTDIAIANLPIETASGSMNAGGGFLHIADNANGDTSSDVIDFQHGNHVMGSTVYCLDDNGEVFTYEELPGGTANGKATGPMTGNQFLSPVGIIFAMATAFEKVNPEQHEFFEEVRRLTMDYVLNTPKEDLDTEKMIEGIAEQASLLIPSES